MPARLEPWATTALISRVECPTLVYQYKGRRGALATGHFIRPTVDFAMFCYLDITNGTSFSINDLTSDLPIFGRQGMLN